LAGKSYFELDMAEMVIFGDSFFWSSISVGWLPYWSF